MLFSIFCVKAVLVYREHCFFEKLVLTGLKLGRGGGGIEERVLCAIEG